MMILRGTPYDTDVWRPHLQLQQVKMELKVCSLTQRRLIANFAMQKFRPAVSAQGQKQGLKQTSARVRIMSALRPKADMVVRGA
jgi:hypothetical protein